MISTRARIACMCSWWFFAWVLSSCLVPSECSAQAGTPSAPPSSGPGTFPGPGEGQGEVGSEEQENEGTGADDGGEDDELDDFRDSSALPVAPMPGGEAPLLRNMTVEETEETEDTEEAEHAEEVENAEEGEGGEERKDDAEPSKASGTPSTLRLDWSGYVRVKAEAVENDPESQFLGRNDGFKLANARLRVRAGYERAFLVTSLEAAFGDREGLNASNAVFAVEPRDVYLGYDFSRYASVWLGRFHSPYDLGELVEVDARTFIDAPLESRGVEPALGYELTGLAQGRQIGVMIHRDRIGLSPDGFDLGYALALTNGRTLKLALNDNDRVAGFMRAIFHFGEMVSLNLAGFTDTRTVGELPNLFDERARGLEVSGTADVFGIRLEAQVLFQRTDFLTSGRPRVDSLGFHAQWSYTLHSITFAYRFAWFDPNTTDREEEASGRDAVSEHTIALAYVPSDEIPLRLALDGSIAQEQEGRRVENNRLAFLAQLAF